MDHIIYQEWPEAIISGAVTEFNTMMHDGGEATEIRAGLLCLDFLTRKSVIGTFLESRIYGARVEAAMRLELLAAQVESELSAAEIARKADDIILGISANLKALMSSIANKGPADIEAYLEARRNKKDVYGKY